MSVCLFVCQIRLEEPRFSPPLIQIIKIQHIPLIYQQLFYKYNCMSHSMKTRVVYNILFFWLCLTSKYKFGTIHYTYIKILVSPPLMHFVGLLLLFWTPLLCKILSSVFNLEKAALWNTKHAKKDHFSLFSFFFAI